MERGLRPYVVAILAIFLAYGGMSCSTTSLRHERDIAYETTCTLAHLFRAIGTEAETPKMRAYVEAAHYDSMTDRTGRALFQAAFASGRAVLANAGFQRGESMMQVIAICAHYGFPECRAFAGQGRAEASAVFRAMNDLAECGKRLWTE